MKKRSQATVLILWILVIAYSSFIFWLSSKSDPLPESGSIPVGDKGYHILLYLVYGALLFLAMACTWADVPKAHIAIFALGFLLLFAVTDEFHQLFVSSREASVTDLIADGLGGLAGILSALVWKVRYG